MKKVYLVFFATKGDENCELTEVYSTYKKADKRRDELINMKHIAHAYIMEEAIR